MNRRFFSYAMLLALASFSIVGCKLEDISGSDDGEDSSTASVRLVNLTSASDLQLTVDDGDTESTIATAVASGAASSYKTLDVTSYSIVASSAGASLSTSSTSSLSLTEDEEYSIVAFERGGLIKLWKLTDDTDEPSSGYAYFTVINAGSDAGSLDVYVVEPDTDITDLTPTFSSVSAASTSLTNAISAGTYDIVVTASNKPNDVRLKLTSVSLASTTIQSLMLTPTSGGALVDGALIEQGGAVALHRNDTARVRVIAAFPAGETSNLAVNVTVGDSSLNSVTAPSIGGYSLVPANTSYYSVEVGDTAVSSLPVASFNSGGDYTVLAYGNTENDAAVTVLTDNNQLPSSGAKIRLVNGAVSAAGLSLSANYANLFSEINFGKSSVYSGITAGTTRLDLTSPATAFTSYTSNVSILSGGVYSLFVLGDTDSAIVLLNKDR
ncbi:DUF4397 domain-containing protein [Permianibacter sp. IMCC34836]|uniref:DUF4397 domain-containing protein n=1 Tax=Permianibacter fluminis TaxID=2738515 RepID=UPI001552291B|nr:DUF4397 domain-containing protein [Permianibacter fluminis]NQD38868.1 DUF4397 domain-containing protein [Permianibacter fluminis]